MPIIPKTLIPKMDSIRLMAKELLAYHCGCHGSLVTIAMRCVAVPIVPKNLHTKYGLNTT